MENLENAKIIQKTYYVHGGDIPRLAELIRLMPNYATKSKTQIHIEDYFYETPDKLLEELGASIRIRVLEKQQILSVVYTKEGKRREFEMEMEMGDKIQDKNEYILFLEDKLQDTYTHTIDADIARMLKSLKVFLYITTERTQLEIFNNTGFTAIVNFDAVAFNTKRHKVYDNILEIKQTCLNDVANKTAYERFYHTLEQKVSLTPMDETKFDAGKRVFRAEY